jgi:uncharacterized membrane protein YiaA
MADELSETEIQAFKVFGVIMIIVGIIAFFIAVTGSETINEGTVTLEEGMSKTVGLDFERGQIVHVSFDVKEGPEAINLIVETQGILSGNFVDVEKAGTNKVTFEVNESQDYYFTFVNSGGETAVFHYDIGLEGYNNNYGYYYVSIITIVFGALILVAFYKDVFF